MSGGKHTPGPWTVLADHTYSSCLAEVGHLIVSAPADSHDWENPAVHAANAHLIAAAPDLLEALRLILPLAKGYRPEGQTDTARRTCNSWVGAAEAAISRALGETPNPSTDGDA